MTTPELTDLGDARVLNELSGSYTAHRYSPGDGLT